MVNSWYTGLICGLAARVCEARMSDERFEKIATADGVARDFCHVRLGDLPRLALWKSGDRPLGRRIDARD